MKRTKTEKMWGISLAVVALCTIILCISVIDTSFSSLLRRIIGVLLIVAIPFMVFFTYKVVKENSSKAKVDMESADSSSEEVKNDDKGKKE